MKLLIEVNRFIEDVTEGKVYYKDSETYNGLWVEYNFLQVKHPSQRKLTKGECVLDFDNVTDSQCNMIIAWLDALRFKYTAWKSSKTGMHIHYWVDVRGKEPLKHIVKKMADKIEAQFGISVDTQPMNHGFIRCEFSYHPEKGEQKTLIKNTVNIIDPINPVPQRIKESLPENEFITFTGGKTKEVDGKMPKCIRYILSHQFSDGRQRLLFVLASWYKANNKSHNEIVELCYEWAKRQDYAISRGKISAFVNSTGGKVGCKFRHELLEEIGVDIGKCEYV